MSETKNLKTTTKSPRKPREKKSSSAEVKKNKILKEEKQVKRETNRIKVEKKIFSFDIDLIDNKDSKGFINKLMDFYNLRDYKKGIVLLFLKNILFSSLISYGLYLFLNTNSFSFQRQTFSEASNNSMIICLMLSLIDIIYFCMLYLLNLYFDYKIKWRRSISALGHAEIVNIVLIILSLLLVYLFKQIPAFLLVVISVYHYLIRYLVIDISSTSNPNKKFFISIVIFIAIIFILTLFFPVITKNLLRIIEIMR